MSTDFIFGHATALTRVRRAPAWPAWGSALCVLAGAGLLVPAQDSAVVALAGYIVSALLTPGLTVAHRFGRRTASKDPYYVPSRSLERLVTFAMVAGIVLGAVHAWFLATELAKK